MDGLGAGEGELDPAEGEETVHTDIGQPLEQEHQGELPTVRPQVSDGMPGAVTE